jgi:hypothetical protein
MPTPRVRLVEDAIPQVEKVGQKIEDVSNGISERVSRFERWLIGLPGKCEATAWHPLEEDPDKLIGLYLKKVSKDWYLLSTIINRTNVTEDHDQFKWQPLASASLSNKIRAIAVFPGLLVSLYSGQKLKADRLIAAANEFDEFAEKMGLDKWEGK